MFPVHAGHTAFVLSNPENGGVRVYHYYAAGYNSPNAGWWDTVKGLIHDTDDLWYRDFNSFGAYLDDLVTNGEEVFLRSPYELAYHASATVQAYAVGNTIDDQKMFNDLNARSEFDGEDYSVLGQKDCHDFSWTQFWTYTGNGPFVPANLCAQLPIGLSANNSKWIMFPSGIYVSHRVNFSVPSTVNSGNITIDNKNLMRYILPVRSYYQIITMP